MSSDEVTGKAAPRAKTYYPVVLRSPEPNNYREPPQQDTYDAIDTTTVQPRAKVHGYANLPQNIPPSEYGNLNQNQGEIQQPEYESIDDANVHGFGFGFEPVVYTNMKSESAEI